MINNFEKIEDFIYHNFFNYSACGQNKYFWFIQIIIRGKDHKDSEFVRNMNLNKGNTNVPVARFRIHNNIELKAKMPMIKAMCDALKARAYIDLSPKSYQAVAKETLVNATQAVVMENWLAAKNAWNSAAAKYRSVKLFMVDFDSKDDEELDRIIKEINATREDLTIVKEVIPTKNGWHVICNPFNVTLFPELDIKKDALTILYSF